MIRFLCITWPKSWSFSFSNRNSNEYSEFVSFRIHLFDLAIPRTQEFSAAPQFKSINSVVLSLHWASLVAQRVKCFPAVWETQVWSLDWEDPLEKEKATYFSIFDWRIPWTEKPGRLQSTGSQRVGHDLWFHFSLLYGPTLRSIHDSVQFSSV